MGLVIICFFLVLPLYQPHIESNLKFETKKTDYTLNDLEKGSNSFTGEIILNQDGSLTFREIEKTQILHFLGFPDLKYYSRYAFGYHIVFVLTMFIGFMIPRVDDRWAKLSKIIFIASLSGSLYLLAWLYIPPIDYSTTVYTIVQYSATFIFGFIIYQYFKFKIWDNKVKEQTKEFILDTREAIAELKKIV